MRRRKTIMNSAPALHPSVYAALPPAVAKARAGRTRAAFCPYTVPMVAPLAGAGQIGASKWSPPSGALDPAGGMRPDTYGPTTDGGLRSPIDIRRTPGLVRGCMNQPGTKCSAGFLEGNRPGGGAHRGGPVGIGVDPGQGHCDRELQGPE
jgi:hypothetical protein